MFRRFETFDIKKFLKIDPGKPIIKIRFWEKFTPILLQALKPSNITSGFKTTGIYSLRPKTIPEKKNKQFYL